MPISVTVSKHVPGPYIMSRSKVAGRNVVSFKHNKSETGKAGRARVLIFHLRHQASLKQQRAEYHACSDAQASDRQT
jgi:hypothetical protein